jgi:hypothetical protein
LSAPRYGIEADLETYPQATPQKTLESVLTAIGRDRLNYLLAHLAEPGFVDERVKRWNGNFEVVVQEVRDKLRGNPETVKDLGRFLKEGEWEVGETAASVRLKDVLDRGVFLRKLGNRWYLENRTKPEAAGK